LTASGRRENAAPNMKKVAVIPGDGIGVDVTREAVKVLRALIAARGLEIELVEMPYGADHFLRTGESFPRPVFEEIRDRYAAVFLGALGDPRIPDMSHARDILFGLRFGLDLYVNFRPVQCFEDRLCPLKGRGAKDVDFVVFRENTEGLYAGLGGNFKKGTPDEVAINEDMNTRKGVERILRAAFEWARAHGKKKLVMSDKSNALRYAHDLWQRAFAEVAREYPDVESSHLYVDALTMQMIKNPAQFQVIVTCNMFGDIVTDLGAQLQGGLGLAASANLHPGRVSMFEPVHGSAPKYAGKDVANPIAAILTVQLLLDAVGYSAEGALVERAVRCALREGKATKDVGGTLGTAATGDFVVGEVTRLVKEK
jgi:3-isopropylmalate dehydrogenase